MVRFYSTGSADNHPVIPLMVFQVIVAFVVAQRNVSLPGQQLSSGSIIIDHIPAIVRRSGDTPNLMHRPQLCPVRHIRIGDSASVTKRYLTWQI